MPCEFPDFLMKKVASRGYLPRLFRLQRGESRQWASAIRQDIQRWGMALPLRKKHSKEVAPAGTERRSPWLVTSDFKPILKFITLPYEEMPHPTAYTAREAAENLHVPAKIYANHRPLLSDPD